MSDEMRRAQVNFGNYRAVAFDFDMTLADTSHVIADLLNETIRHFGYPEESYDYILPVIGNTHPIMLGHAAHETDTEKLLVMQAYYRKLCAEQMPERTVFFPGAEECVRALSQRGFRLGIVSIKLAGLLRASLDRYGLSDCFQYVLGGDDVGKPKPDPEGLLTLLELFGVRKNELLYIGDSYVDEKAAEAAGVDFCVMLLGGTRPEQFRKTPRSRMFSGWDCILDLL